MMHLLLRHGESVSNAANDVIEGGLGLPLTPLGAQQAEFNGAIFGRVFDLEEFYVSTSPADRTQETAARFLSAAEIQTRIHTVNDANIRDFGSALGRPKEYRKSFDRIDDIPGAESLETYLERSNNFLNYLIGQGQNTLSFVHRGTIRAVWSILSGADYDSLREFRVPHLGGLLFYDDKQEVSSILPQDYIA